VEIPRELVARITRGDDMAQFKCVCLSGVVVALALVGCAKTETAPAAEYPKNAPAPVENPPTQPAQAPAATTEIPLEPVPDQPAAQPRLTDAQIVKITDTVNTGEVEQAKLAKQRSKNAAVKKFASQMVSQHTTAKQQGATLSKQIKLEPEASPVSVELTSKGTKTLEELKAIDAESFDRTYMDGQVEQHQEVLSQLDNHLIPEATNPQLKAELQKTRTMVEAHLNHAKQIQGDL
jgi:putative membrane protein